MKNIERGHGKGNSITFWPVTISTTKAGFPYVDSKAPNELDHHFKSPIAIYFLGMLRWALREPVILYKMYCQAWFDKNYFGRGKRWIFWKRTFCQTEGTV